MACPFAAVSTAPCSQELLMLQKLFIPERLVSGGEGEGRVCVGMKSVFEPLGLLWSCAWILVPLLPVSLAGQVPVSMV